MARCDYKLVIHYGYQHEGTLAADYRATLLSGMQRLTEEEAAGQVRSAAAACATFWRSLRDLLW